MYNVQQEILLWCRVPPVGVVMCWKSRFKWLGTENAYEPHWVLGVRILVFCTCRQQILLWCRVPPVRVRHLLKVREFNWFGQKLSLSQAWFIGSESLRCISCSKKSSPGAGFRRSGLQRVENRVSIGLRQKMRVSQGVRIRTFYMFLQQNPLMVQGSAGQSSSRVEGGVSIGLGQKLGLCHATFWR